MIRLNRFGWLLDLATVLFLALPLDPSTLTWASTASMKVSREGETVTVLLNGQVLFAGGETFDKSWGALTPIASVELYKP